MHYYQFNIGDYRKDTAHLKPIEHYIYRTLIDWCYLDEKPLPNDIALLTRRLSLGNECSTDVQQVLNDFFTLTDNGYIHCRIEVDINEYKELINSARAAGIKSGQARRDKKKAIKERSFNEPSTNLELTNNHKQETNIKPIVINGVDNCPHEQIISLYKDILPMGTQPLVWNGARSSALKARWREETKRQNLDWWKGFFLHIKKSPFLTGQISNGERKPFTISLDWIIKAENFAKIIEGKYHA